MKDVQTNPFNDSDNAQNMPWHSSADFETENHVYISSLFVLKDNSTSKNALFMKLKSTEIHQVCMVDMTKEKSTVLKNELSENKFLNQGYTVYSRLSFNSVMQANQKLVILLSKPLECWNYSQM
jgi:hypothetical protein